MIGEQWKQGGYEWAVSFRSQGPKGPACLCGFMLLMIGTGSWLGRWSRAELLVTLQICNGRQHTFYCRYIDGAHTHVYTIETRERWIANTQSQSP